MAHPIQGIRCPECRQQWPQGFAQRVFTPTAECPVCTGLTDGPFMCLPCGHLLCQEHFQALTSRTLPVHMTVPARQQPSVRYSVVLETEERVAINLESSCEHTWGLLRDRLSVNIRDPEDEDTVSVDPGRVHLYVQEREVNYSVEIPPQDRDAAVARVEETDSQDILDAWRRDGRQELADIVEREIKPLDVPGTLDDTAGTDGHYPEVLRSLDRLTKRQRTRGGRSDFGSFLEEVLEVLREVTARPKASCASVWEKLQDEFGF